MAVVGVQIVLRLVWVETLLELDQLQAYSGEHFLDLTRVDLLLRERQSVTHWTADKWGHTPQEGSGLMMVVAAHLSFTGEHGCDEPHGKASRPHTISHPVDFAQFLSAILACPAKTVKVLLHLLFSKGLDRHHFDYTTEVVAACAVRVWLGTARCLKLLVALASLPSLVGDF